MAAIHTALQLGVPGYTESTFTNDYNPTAQFLDTAGKEIAGGHIADSTDAITHIGVRITNEPTSPPIYQVSLQGMGSTGLPDGTVLGGDSPASATFDGSAWAANTFHWIALDNPYTPTVGQVIVPVLEYSSGTIGASNRMRVANAWTQFLNELRFPGMFTSNNWSTATKSQGESPLVIRTASRRYGFMFIGSSPTAVSLGTIGHRDTLKFTLPDFFSTITCYGLRVGCNPPSSGAFKLGIWNAAGTELAAESINEDTLRTTLDGRITCGFTDPVTITPSTTFYAGIERTEANTPGLSHVELAESDDQLAYPLGTAACRATWDGSAWTVHPTFRPLSLELLISDITGGGGASFPPIGPGGLVF